MIDVVIPNGNEKDFIRMAEKLGFSSLCFIYEKPTVASYDSKLKIYSGIISKKIKHINSDLVVVPNADRTFFESEHGDMGIHLEIQTKDFLHHKSSGLNQVLCELAKQNRKITGIDFSMILNSNSVERALVFGRIVQNIHFARKYKFDLALCSFASNPSEMRSPHDLKAFLISLGMHPSEAQNALSCVEKKILDNIRKKSPSYIGEGVEIVD